MSGAGRLTRLQRSNQHWALAQLRARQDKLLALVADLVAVEAPLPGVEALGRTLGCSGVTAWKDIDRLVAEGRLKLVATAASARRVGLPQPDGSVRWTRDTKGHRAPQALPGTPALADRLVVELAAARLAREPSPSFFELQKALNGETGRPAAGETGRVSREALQAALELATLDGRVRREWDEGVPRRSRFGFLGPRGWLWLDWRAADPRGGRPAAPGSGDDDDLIAAGLARTAARQAEARRWAERAAAIEAAERGFGRDYFTGCVRAGGRIVFEEGAGA